MILKVFAVYDSQAEAYMQPHSLATRGIGIRAFQQAAQDPKTQIAKYPTEHVLYELGEYDDSNGKMLPYHEPLRIGNANELRPASVDSKPSDFPHVVNS